MTITVKNTEITEIYPLLQRDFHSSAVKPLTVFKRLCDMNYYRILQFFNGTDLVGYACLAGFSDEKIRLLDYFAVPPSLRCKGYGKILIKELAHLAKEQSFSIILESENPAFSTDAADEIIRKRRIAFYLSCNASPTRVTSRVGPDNYCIMSLDSKPTDVEISDFMHKLYNLFFGEQAGEKVTIEIVHC